MPSCSGSISATAASPTALAPNASGSRSTRSTPGVIERARSLVEGCFPNNPVGLVPCTRGNCLYVSVYSSHLGCLFPQHGPGRKHERRIELEPWQQRVVEAEPWPFIRACIWTDGCSFINRTDIHRPKPYEYLSYHFC